jgi:hypothetical protein
MTDPADTPRPDPDFSLAGKALLEWLGEEPHEATIKAAEQALAVPNEAFIVAVFHEPTLPVHKFALAQRRVLRLWFGEQHKPGRIRLNARKRLEPQTSQDVTVVTVTYEPKVRQLTDKLDKIHGLAPAANG